MPIQITKDNDGLVVVRAEGKLLKEDYSLFTAQFEETVRQRGKLRILFDMTDFDGWGPQGMWEEAKFDVQHNTDIQRLAVVGDEKWHHALTSVLKPFASAEVRYFHRDESAQARQWLLSPESLQAAS